MIGFLFPESLSGPAASLLVIASFFTSGLTAAAGIGGGLLMLALMTYLIPIQALIPVHGLVQLGSNSGRSWVQRSSIDWRITRLFLVGGIFGATSGALLAAELPKHTLEVLLGIFILVLVWIKFPPLRNVGNTLVTTGGALTTFVSMFAGATGPLVAVFLSKLFEEHRQLVATHGATMTMQHGVKVLAFSAAGFAFWEWVPLVILMIVSGYLGTIAGTRIMDRLPEKTLKLAFKTILSIVALDLLRRGVSHAL